MYHEQNRVKSMSAEELVAYTLDSKDKMPLGKPFDDRSFIVLTETKFSPHDHKDVANHRKLRAHVQEVVDDLLVLNKIAVKMENKALRAVASTFSEDALTVWTSCY
jgi:hypothetical protein